MKEFKPRRGSRSEKNYSEIVALFESGDFKRAYRLCRENGYHLDSFQDSLTKMGRRMLYSRPGELVSLIHKYGIDVGYDIQSILRSQLSLKDYHGFLKNVHRFRLLNDFGAEVEHAINSLNRTEEARAWRMKFQEMSSNDACQDYGRSLDGPPKRGDRPRRQGHTPL